MRDGFVRVTARTPTVRVADVAFNVRSCVTEAKAACAAGARVVVLPELAVTGATCGDLFWQDSLLAAARQGVLDIAAATASLDALVLVGAPLRAGAALYDCAVALASGRVLAAVPRSFLADAQMRHFAAGPQEALATDLGLGVPVPFGTDQLLACAELPELVVAVEVGDEPLAPRPPCVAHALSGATLICNLVAAPALAGAADRLRMQLEALSARLTCGYACACAGTGESTTDAVFPGHDLVCENGALLAEAAPFAGGRAASEIDVVALAAERRRTPAFRTAPAPPHLVTPFSLTPRATSLTRPVDAHPFVPKDPADLPARCEEILAIQSHALVRRLAHTGSTHAVVGVSGGLDSTLALLVCARAFGIADLDRENIVAVTMPGFGTTGRTRCNAGALARALGATLREVPIAAAVCQHFADIGHDGATHDVTYENAQARERTQIVMDIANQLGGLAVGTGDLSELVLGWATFNGDHMSMYGVNAGVPKTLVRHLVRHVADTTLSGELSRVLLDVLDTPVSPELLPANDDGSIAQQTEDLVGPYELHDFFLHQVLRQGARPRKVLRLACRAFAGSYDEATVLCWLKTFYQRFFSQQFKRSCLPDGPVVGTVGVSPRGGLSMPSDATATLWLSELQEL